jgi:hypothetical protein
MISLREARLPQRGSPAASRSRCTRSFARNDDASPHETLVATIPGSDPAAGDVVFSCHLDHRSRARTTMPAALANLEIARTLKTLIDARRIPPPVRTLRFIWPSEMTGTIRIWPSIPTSPPESGPPCTSTWSAAIRS